MTIKELRIKNNLTQAQASELSGIPLRTYKMYENDITKENSIKYNYIKEKLIQYGLVDEEHGVLTLEEIKEAVAKVFENYDVDSAILFGSYARGAAGEKSDVDLVISTDITGLSFYGLVEELRNALIKKVDLLDLKQLLNNEELLKNVLREGIRIYAKG